MVITNGVGVDCAEGADGTAARAGGFEVAGGVLFILEMLVF